MNNLKRTPLFEEHIKLKAKIVPFAGWEMPVQYTNIIEEHNTVRNKAGIFDVSHMGEVFISGEDSFSAIQKLIPKDITGLQTGKAVYSQLTNEQGGIIDDLIIYKLENKYLLIINASRITEDVEWIIQNTKEFNINIENQSDEYAMIALQGPMALNIANDAGFDDIPDRFHIKEIKDGFVSRTGYTGEDGVEIIIKNNEAAKLWVKLLEKGNQYGLKPIGLGARDTLRLEAALPLYGNDLDEGTTPIEAGLSWSVSKSKEADYIGKSIILKQLKENTCQKTLVGFKMLDRAIARHGYDIYQNNEKIGTVTSGGPAPSIGENIGLGYINADAKKEIGSNLDIMIRNKLYPAKIVKKPFYVKK